MNPIDEVQASSVQALLLYAIVLHALHRTNEAEDCLRRAAKISRHIGMNDPAFASNTAGGNLCVEESYRRTWWELHTTEIYVAALHRRVAPSTALVRTMPQLPGLSGQGNSKSLQSFENRVFALGSQEQYPSAYYKIEASRIISRILSLDPTHATHISDVEAVDHAIASWKLYAPSGQACVNSHGEVDESLFQAHYLILCASIFLHFPRSALPPRVPSAGDIACARAQAVEISSPVAAHHTAKVIAASTAIANLAALPCALDSHSPFFVCGLVLGTVVQLAAATLHLHDPSQLQRHRDHIVLMLGVLSHLGERWTVARNAAACLKAISQVIFVDPAVAPMPQQAHAIPAEFENFSNIDWLDMFTPDEIQGTVWNG
ncbi:hypothetical protein B0A48_00766 [Cryoendolithus antarcticus]|uniref:Xylanolytic transcriptional activator regulatory domain-containing protein n=1 Tax=Cryoendolithus antarcticus TaxID=1507870 RepID=A0A1V8TRL7_9PEZI|nr:hypothetical protein B0A48_00766 [Cryoendolithus antarcticus]